jgi:peptidoglycan/xylan/chitin deacetylase (PgdA/CDA1 family)
VNSFGRDLVGYGEHPPDAAWPGGARVAVSFVLNYEEGGERSPLDGDSLTEPMMHEIVGSPPVDARCRTSSRCSSTGAGRASGASSPVHVAQAAADRLRRAGQALERNPEAARAMAAAGWEVIGHGWRWIDYLSVHAEVEREHIRHANEVIRAPDRRRSGGAPAG